MHLPLRITTCVLGEIKIGADDPIRTDDRGITNALLYQLSYVGSGQPSLRDKGTRAPGNALQIA